MDEHDIHKPSRADEGVTDGPNSAAAATDLFVRTHRIPLVRFFQRRVGSHADVDDLVQEVFYRILALDRHRSLRNPEGYVFQVATNILRDRARRDATKRAFSQSLALDSESKLEEFSPERVLLGRQAVSQLRQALEELPQRTRAVFLLHRFEGFKYKEIAARLGVSASSVEKHMMAAIKHVHERMGENND